MSRAADSSSESKELNENPQAILLAATRSVDLRSCFLSRSGSRFTSFSATHENVENKEYDWVSDPAF
jgi:hypothetical protein